MQDTQHGQMSIGSKMAKYVVRKLAGQGSKAKFHDRPSIGQRLHRHAL